MAISGIQYTAVPHVNLTPCKENTPTHLLYNFPQQMCPWVLYYVTTQQFKNFVSPTPEEQFLTNILPHTLHWHHTTGCWRRPAKCTWSTSLQLVIQGLLERKGSLDLAVLVGVFASVLGNFFCGVAFGFLRGRCFPGMWPGGAISALSALFSLPSSCCTAFWKNMFFWVHLTLQSERKSIQLKPEGL